MGQGILIISIFFKADAKFAPLYPLKRKVAEFRESRKEFKKPI